MHVELNQVDGKTIGWKLIPDTHEDRLQLGSIRNLVFWSDTPIVYAGMTGDDTTNTVTSLEWIKEEYHPNVIRAKRIEG
jgi:hypothetical protein